MWKQFIIWPLVLGSTGGTHGYQPYNPHLDAHHSTCFAAKKIFHGQPPSSPSASSASSSASKIHSKGRERIEGGGDRQRRGHSSKSPISIASLIAKSENKIDILRTVESLELKQIDGATAAAAWDRISQPSVDDGPRAAHLPLLHTDRAFTLLVERTQQLIPTLSPGHRTSIITSLAKLRYRPDNQFLKDMLVTPQIPGEAQNFSQAARLAAGLAKLDYQMELEESTRLADLMTDRVKKATDDGPIHTESVALALWSLAVTGVLQGREELMEQLILAATSRLRTAHAHALEGGGRSNRKTKGLVRICRYLKTALLFTPRTTNGARAPAEALEDGIRDVWAGLGEWLDPVQGSRLQKEVESVLRAGGGIVAEEWEDGVLTVDMALHFRDKSNSSLLPVALEVDGPSHFFVNHPRRPTGDTLIKHQALREAYPGQWSAMISIPHFQWPKNARERLDFMRRKLKNAGLDPSDFLDEKLREGDGSKKKQEPKV